MDTEDFYYDENFYEDDAYEIVVGCDPVEYEDSV